MTSPKSLISKALKLVIQSSFISFHNCFLIDYFIATGMTMDNAKPEQTLSLSSDLYNVILKAAELKKKKGKELATKNRMPHASKAKANAKDQRGKRGVEDEDVPSSSVTLGPAHGNDLTKYVHKIVAIFILY